MYFIGNQETKNHGYLPLANCYQDARSENNVGCGSSFVVTTAEFHKEVIWGIVFYTKKITKPSGDMYQDLEDRLHYT